MTTGFASHTRFTLALLCALSQLASLGCDEDSSEGLDGGAAVDSGRADGGGAAVDGAAVDGAVAGGDCPLLPGTVKESMTAGPGCVRLMRTSIQGGTLTLAAGTTVQVASGGYLKVEKTSTPGALVAIGTESAPISFASANANPQPGDWQCLRFETSDSELRYVTIKHAGAGCAATGANYEAALDLDAPVRAIENVTITDSKSYGVFIHHNAGVRSFKNNRFARNGKPSIKVSVDELPTLGQPNAFETPGDVVEVDTTYALEGDGTIRNPGVPLRATGTMEVSQATITIEAGTRLELRGGGMSVNSSTVNVEGTAAAPVVITSANANPQPGDWGCLWMSGASGSRISHAIIEYAGAGCTGGSVKTSIYASTSTQISNTVFRNLPADASAIQVNAQCSVIPGAWCSNTFTGIARKVTCSGPGASYPEGCP